MYCIKCNSNWLRDEAVFCPLCGGELICPTMNCPECKGEILAEDRCCIHCGKAIKKT